MFYVALVNNYVLGDIVICLCRGCTVRH